MPAPGPPTTPRPPWTRLVLAGLLGAGLTGLLVMGVSWLLGSGAGLARSTRAFVPILAPFASFTLIAIVLTIVAYRRAKRWHPWLTQATLAGVFLGGLVAALVTVPRLRSAFVRSPGGMAFPVGLMMAMVGVQLLARGLKGRRLGETFHCPKCDYERAEPEAEAPLHCPECGHLWLGSWVKGRLERSAPMAWTGAALLVVPLLLLAVTLTSLGGQMVRALPTGAVIRLAGLDAWGNNKDIWGEIGARRFTPEQEADLARRLLDLRLESGYLYGPPSAWLEGAVLNGGSSGVLPASVCERYFAELFEPRIDVPERVRVGEHVPIRIVGPYRAGGAANWMYVRVEEVRVEGVSLDPARWQPRGDDGWIFALYLASEELASGDLHSELMDDAPPVLDTASPGVRRVTMRLRECLVPKSTRPGTTTLHERDIFLERVVVVEGR